MGVALGDDRAWLRKTVAIDEQTRERDQYPKKPVAGEEEEEEGAISSRVFHCFSWECYFSVEHSKTTTPTSRIINVYKS